MDRSITWKLFLNWLGDRLEEPCLAPWIFVASLCGVGFALCLLGAVGAAIWSHFRGDAAVLNLVLKAAFWAATGGMGAFVLGVLCACWEDFVAERRGEKRNIVTIQEILKKTLEFERWCR